MSDRVLDDSMEDLGLDEIEGAAEGYTDEGDFGDAGDDSGDDEFIRAAIGGAARPGAAATRGDGFESLDDGDEFSADEGDHLDGGDSYDSEAFEDAIADALDAGDSDEFLRRIRRIAGAAARGAQRIGRGVGAAARTIAPIARLIPLPQAQAIARVANVLGRTLADGADESEALEDLFDYAETEDVDAAAPVIAGLALRQRMPGLARAPRNVRRQVVRGVTQATRTLTGRQGPAAARVVPALVQRVQRGVQRRAIPPRQAGAAVQRIAQRIARNPRAIQNLAQRARGIVGRAPRGACPHCRRSRSFTLRGPVQLTIRSR
jgi:hypothetical protein